MLSIIYSSSISEGLWNKAHKELEDDTIKAYFIYLLNSYNEKEYFTGEIFQHWKQSGLTTFEEINNYWMIKINLDKFQDDSFIWNSESSFSWNEDDAKTYWKIFKAIFETLNNINYGRPIEGVTTKSHYLNNLTHYITNYSKSNKWSTDEKDLIKKNKSLSIMLLDLLVEMKLVEIKQNIVEFNQFEISNQHSFKDEFLFGMYLKILWYAYFIIIMKQKVWFVNQTH